MRVRGSLFIEHDPHELGKRILSLAYDEGFFVDPLEHPVVTRQGGGVVRVTPPVTFPSEVFHARKVTGARSLLHRVDI